MIRSKSILLLIGAAVFVLAALALAGCGGSNNSAAPPTTASGAPATIGVESGNDLGTILVNSQGHTLYLFQADTGGASACTGPCAVAWPPLRVNSKPTVGSGADEAKVGTASRSDGKPQVTYNGHRLYLYEHDHKAGDTNGEGLNAFGGSWFALSSAGNQVTRPAGNPGGGGY